MNCMNKRGGEGESGSTQKAVRIAFSIRFDLPGFCPAVYPDARAQADCTSRTGRPAGARITAQAGTLDALSAKQVPCRSFLPAMPDV